ncbi:hypothetical protein TNIN_211351 [Trichonephila inaurata madagascariensis]|uniref:Uncharacterized protein n=1 Tax=Trichonephila inaurata madagascariensis TaxID=2747483 RepID=A0A8X6Y0U1_9ARAC|nr:hypothetical protein TNIN_211351 [Trichonephila inaurata madagascariensis]
MATGRKRGSKETQSAFISNRILRIICYIFFGGVDEEGKKSRHIHMKGGRERGGWSNLVWRFRRRSKSCTHPKEMVKMKRAGGGRLSLRTTPSGSTRRRAWRGGRKLSFCSTRRSTRTSRASRWAGTRRKWRGGQMSFSCCGH